MAVQFVDETTIRVKAGSGGHGACSFLRLKFMPLGGPDGGDGGSGGSVFLRADPALNTFIDYRCARLYCAQSGENGRGRQCTGRDGADLILPVPVGTVAYDCETNECIADFATPEQVVCIAQGGRRGIGNARFKSSVNRSPTHTISGSPGETRQVRLELKVLADVGLLGLPNSGKSTLLCALSAARPKVANYPFTTLYPHLGVVEATPLDHFVVTDLPGLIAGAAQGEGLGIRFLKHVSRARLLWHVVDIGTSIDEPVANIRIILRELEQFNEGLLTQKPQWLILNKTDLLPPGEIECYVTEIRQALTWQGKIFAVSGLVRQGLKELIQQTLQYLHTV